MQPPQKQDPEGFEQNGPERPGKRLDPTNSYKAESAVVKTIADVAIWNVANGEMVSTLKANMAHRRIRREGPKLWGN